MEHCRIPYADAWDMPVEIRHWWMGRKSEDMRKRAGQQEPA